MLKRMGILLLLWMANFCYAQSDSTKALSFSAYAEGYFSYDFSQPQNNEKPNSFITIKDTTRFRLI